MQRGAVLAFGMLADFWEALDWNGVEFDMGGNTGVFGSMFLSVEPMGWILWLCGVFAYVKPLGRESWE